MEHNGQPLEQPSKPFASVSDNLAFIRQSLGSPNDLLIRTFRMAEGEKAAVVCIEGLADKQVIQNQVISQLMQESGSRFARTDRTENTGQMDDEYSRGTEAQTTEQLSLQDLRRSSDWDDIMLTILSGDAALFVEDMEETVLIGSKGWKSRAIEEPQTESLIRGPRDGFTEDLRTNTALIRRRIRDSHLRFDSYCIGRRSRKDVTVAYIEGIANPMLVNEVKRRVGTIDMDDPEGSGFIEQWIQDHYWSPFPQIMNTERPDKVSGALLQGKVAVLVDGTPFQLVMPVTIGSFIQSPEDYYQNWILSSVLRILRVFAVFIALFLPGLYIALLEYHHGMLPSKLAFSVAGTREGVPFPAVVETFLMEATLELLREAGVRLPKSIGQTIGVVGGLVIGEAAVTAGIVSPVMVVVVAVTAIASFAIPSYGFAISIRLMRFLIMIAGSVFGLYGIVLAMIITCIHLVNLRSFGIPYTAPLAPLRLSDWRDLIYRLPVIRMSHRPEILETMDTKRLNTSSKRKGSS
ncbi:spore germination protein [Paenibacillus sp. JDR-2]|uniref:spore germination protein n=1 Tax=Paenibacillus sp. (strain JDR-2) TaxID=324057 RepID=UPI0001668F9B|nr:spore germination protein [Paenibacillus sp. JDR-2]ACS99647.1 GerA spore germination protein [Paenibacillus sp. JDR-2]